MVNLPHDAAFWRTQQPQQRDTDEPINVKAKSQQDVEDFFNDTGLGGLIGN